MAQAGVGGEGGEWMRGLGLGSTNHVGTGGVLDVCLCCGWCRWRVGRWRLGPGSGAVVGNLFDSETHESKILGNLIQ